ncbi:MAG: Acetyl xylan esterase [Verrucomicrobiaceae bacterium]|nr:Acetyl xylan esterase [Verrucomicrobiaceae bacterium]
MSLLSRPFDRRSLLRAAGIQALAWTVGDLCLGAEAPPLTPLNRFPQMMQTWLLEQVKAAEAHGNKWRSELKTKADAEAYVNTVRTEIRECFGPMPEKTPLNAKVTGVLERDTYRIEKVIFESRPGYLVTGNLYVPKGRTGKMPGVVGVCGHSINGKAAEPYQGFAQGLARQGYVAFIFDPVGQGERFQFMKEGLKSRYGGSVQEHIQMGNPMLLMGEFLGSWFAWDGIRALDYLLSRYEVDPAHVGITGNSGGGTQTTWLAALDDRWTMAAPACFVTTFRRNAENELPADTEQCPPKVLQLGLDHSDFIAAMAPRPAILLTQEKDFFDVRGGEEAFKRLKHLYTLLGKPENIQLQTGPDPHGYSQPNREAMYRFFNKITGVSKEEKEPALTQEKEADLWATPKGQVSELNSLTLMSFMRDKATKLALVRGLKKSQGVVNSVHDLLNMPSIKEVPEYRILRGAGSRKYPAKGYCDYAVATAPHIETIVTELFDEAGFTSRPTRGRKRAVLYVSHHSADEELRSEPLLADLIKAEPEAAIFACDVRGIGDSQPNTCGANTFLQPYGCHYFYAAHGVMLGAPLVGQRTFDVLRVIQWLMACGHEEVHLAGRGWGALPAAFAALLSDKVKQVTLKNALTSYADLMADEDQKWPYAAILPDALKDFDLPDVYAALAAKGLKNLEPWGAADGMKG